MEKTEHIRRCVIEVSPEILADLLQLPAGVFVDAVWQPLDRPGPISLRVTGMGDLTAQGDTLRHVFGVVTRRFNSDGAELKHSINWI